MKSAVCPITQGRHAVMLNIIIHACSFFILPAVMKNPFSIMQNAERQTYLSQRNASLCLLLLLLDILWCSDDCWFVCLLFFFFSLKKAMALLASYWCFFWRDYSAGIFFEGRKRISSLGFRLLYFPCCLGCHSDKYAKSLALENKHLSFFK